MCAVSNIEGKLEPIYKRLLVLIRFKNPNKTIPAIAPVNLLAILEGKAAIPDSACVFMQSARRGTTRFNRSRMELRLGWEGSALRVRRRANPKKTPAEV